MFATTWICETTINFMISNIFRGSGTPGENLTFEWRCAVSVKYMPGFEDLVPRKFVKYLINNLDIDNMLK